MNTLEKIKIELLAKANAEVQKTGNGFFQLWQLSSGKAVYSNQFVGKLNYFIEKETQKGFEENDINIYVSFAQNNLYAWYKYIHISITNKISDAGFTDDGFVSFKDRYEFTKEELSEADAPYNALVKQNRALIGDENACIEFLKAEKFLQNNLTDMKFDQETHDFVLSIKKILAEAEQKAQAEKKTIFENWAKENGSDLLKLRIKHGQNWISIAEQEWALQHTKGFQLWGDRDNPNETWTVKNGTLEQLLELEEAISEDPGHEIVIERCKWVDEDGEVEHSTFLKCYIQTPFRVLDLYKEIEDINEE